MSGVVGWVLSEARFDLKPSAEPVDRFDGKASHFVAKRLTRQGVDEKGNDRIEVEYHPAEVLEERLNHQAQPWQVDVLHAHTVDVHSGEWSGAQNSDQHLNEQHGDQLPIFGTQAFESRRLILRLHMPMDASHVDNRQNAEDCHQCRWQKAGEDEKEHLKGELVLVEKDIAIEICTDVVDGPPDQRVKVCGEDQTYGEYDELSGQSKVAPLTEASVMAAGEEPIDAGENNEPLDQTQRRVDEQDA